MIVRYEEIKNSDEVLVISETGKYLGKMLIIDFIDCIDKDRDTFEEDDYLYFFADKKELEKRFL